MVLQAFIQHEMERSEDFPCVKAPAKGMAGPVTYPALMAVPPSSSSMQGKVTRALTLLWLSKGSLAGM